MLQIVKGCNLTDASKQTAAFKLAGGSVLSGEPMIVERSAGSNVGDPETVSYNKATSDNANKGYPVAFAFTDSDSFDVVAAGSILGISALDTFELQTALYNAAVTYTPGTELVVKTDGILVKNAGGDVFVVPSGTSVSGFTQIPDISGIAYVTPLPATAGDYDIVGTVTEGVVTLKGNVAVAKAAINNPGFWGASIDPEGYVSVQTSSSEDPRIDNTITGGPVLWTEATKTKEVLQFATTWKRQVTVS